MGINHSFKTHKTDSQSQRLPEIVLLRQLKTRPIREYPTLLCNSSNNLQLKLEGRSIPRQLDSQLKYYINLYNILI